MRPSVAYIIIIVVDDGNTCSLYVIRNNIEDTHKFNIGTMRPSSFYKVADFGLKIMDNKNRVLLHSLFFHSRIFLYSVIMYEFVFTKYLESK